MERDNPYLDYLMWLNEAGYVKVNPEDFENADFQRFSEDYIKAMDQLDDESYIPESEGSPPGFTITTKEQYDAWLGMVGYYWVYPY